MKISLSLCVASVFYILLALSDGRNGPLERGVGIPTIPTNEIIEHSYFYWTLVKEIHNYFHVIMKVSQNDTLFMS